MKTITILVLATAAAALTACGGDGSPNGPDPEALRITSSNQTTVARATVASGFAIARTSTVSAADRVSAQSAGQVGASGAAGALDRAVRAALAPFVAQRRVAVLSAAHPSAAVTAPAETCATGGTRTATFDDRDGNSATSAGDVVTVVFAGCSFDQVVLDGTMVVTVTGASATTLSGAMQFTQVKVTAGAVVTTITGAADVTEADSGSETDDTIVARSTGLGVTVASPSYSDTIALASGFTIVTTAPDSGDGATIRLDGRFSPSSLPNLDGGLTVATLQAAVISPASAYPTAGKLRVSDDFGGVLVLSVTDGTNVDLQLDADGNGTFEGDSVVAWSTLLPH